jgi:DNA-binding transcriptional regulator YiaG
MAFKKAPQKIAVGRAARAASPRQPGVVGRNLELSEVDLEIIGALTEFRETLRDRTSLETKYTVRMVAVVVPPPRLGPDDVRKTREALGVSQPVFADFLGTSPSTIRSWEQGQKPPSPMARRFLGLIASDLPYWKNQFRAMIQTRAGEDEKTTKTDI